MRKKELYRKVTEWFSANMEVAETELHYDTPFHLLIAVILSAQCTDKRVNIHTPQIFARFPEPSDLASATFEEVYELIKSISFPNNKARHLIGMATKLVSDFGGEVPSEPDLLETLPGVGRKTANVIRGNIYNDPSIVVDTHVKRSSGKFGLTKETDPVKIEMDLMKILPKEQWILYNIHIIRLGRTICTARKPQCDKCFLRDLCKSGNHSQ